MKELLLLTTAVVLFMINSFAISGSSGESTAAENAANGKPAQEILNKIACKNKEPGEQVKDQTNGKMITCSVTKK